MIRADSSTIRNKFLVGYQGRFACPGDGDPITETGWKHWIDTGGQPTTDLWPDVSHYPPCELFPVNTLKLRTGEHPQLFSSRNPATVHRHFHWMAINNVDGAFLQRPLHCMHQSKLVHWRDDIGRHVRSAAEMEHRVFAIMYDVSGVASELVQGMIQKDWNHLLHEEQVLDSPSYLRERGRAVVCLYGFGFAARNHNPDVVKAIISYIREATPGGVYIIAGVPSHWRTSDGDADPNPKFLEIWLNEVDAISPWTVGCYSEESQADKYAERLNEDLGLLRVRQRVKKWRNVEYMPVVFPGYSDFNGSGSQCGFNSIRRNGGQFFWRQIYNACVNGVTMIYGATWDEFSEGTALLPAVPKAELLPVSHYRPLMSLDEDGYDLPSDWYMRICGLAKEFLANEAPINSTFPLERLLQYWDTPYHVSVISCSGAQPVSASSAIVEEPLPPPYSENSSHVKHPLSRYSTSSLLLEVHKRQLSTPMPVTSLPSRPLPPTPANTNSIGLESDERHACHCRTSDSNPYTRVSALSDVACMSTENEQKPSSAGSPVPVPVAPLVDSQSELFVSMTGTPTADPFSLLNATFSERRSATQIFAKSDLAPNALTEWDTFHASLPDRTQTTQISEFDSYLDDALTLHRSPNSKTASSPDTVTSTPSPLPNRGPVSVALSSEPQPDSNTTETSSDVLATFFGADVSSEIVSRTSTPISTIFSSGSDATSTSEHPTTSSVSSKMRVDNLRSIVRRLKPQASRRDSDARVPPAPLSATPDVLQTTIDASKGSSKKQRREELAKELVRREKEAKSQKDQDSVKRRPRRRSSTVCLWGTPDKGFTM